MNIFENAEAHAEEHRAHEMTPGAKAFLAIFSAGAVGALAWVLWPAATKTAGGAGRGATQPGAGSSKARPGRRYVKKGTAKKMATPPRQPLVRAFQGQPHGSTAPVQQFGRTPPGHAPPPPAHRRAGGSVSNAMFTDIDGQHWTGTYDGTTFTAVESNSLDPTKSDVMPWVLQTTPGHVYKMGPGSDGKWSNLGDQGAYEPADSGGGGGGGGAPQQDPSVDPSTGQPYAQPSTGMPYGAPQYPTSAPQYPTSAPQYPTAAPQYAQQADLGMDPSGDQMMDTSSDGSTDGMIGSGDVNDMLDFGGG